MMTDPTDNSALLDDDDDFDDAMNDEIEDGDDDDFGDVFEEPPVLSGIIRGHVSSCKKFDKNPKQIILEIKSEEAATRGQTFDVWFDMAKGFNQVNFKRVAATLGCTVKQLGKKQWAIKGGLKALTNKEGLFVVHTYRKNTGEVRSDLAQGVPKSEKSPEWKEWVEDNPLNDEQLAVLKKSCGVIPKEHMKLFDSSVSEEDEEL